MYKNILYPLDILDETCWHGSLPIVKEYVQTFKAKLHIMSVIPNYGMTMVSQYFPEGSVDKVIAKTKEQLHHFADTQLKEKNIDVGNIIVSKGSSVYQAIIDTAEEIKADLIMVSAHRPELRDYLLGPNAAKVVRHTKTSVLVMRY
jgi:nucleotide-binding universal stress UspA family protein